VQKRKARLTVIQAELEQHAAKNPSPTTNNAFPRMPGVLELPSVNLPSSSSKPAFQTELFNADKTVSDDGFAPGTRNYST
jgi:hypothetical protein